MLEPNLRTDIGMGPRGFGKTLKCFKRGWPVSVQIDPIVVIFIVFLSVC